MIEIKLLGGIGFLERKKITRTIISCLRKLNHPEMLLSGEESGLQNVWDEICVQIQGEMSYYWQAYEEIINNCIKEELMEIPVEVKDIFCYLGQDEYDDSDVLVIDDAINYIREDVLEKAGMYENKRINKYIYDMF